MPPELVVALVFLALAIGLLFGIRNIVKLQNNRIRTLQSERRNPRYANRWLREEHEWPPLERPCDDRRNANGSKR